MELVFQGDMTEALGGKKHISYLREDQPYLEKEQFTGLKCNMEDLCRVWSTKDAIVRRSLHQTDMAL